MYSYEIDNYLKDRNYVLTYDEYKFVSSTEKSPQISRISYSSMDNSFVMYTNDGWIWKYYIKGEK